jgi:ribosomal protein L35AE/L33A
MSLPIGRVVFLQSALSNHNVAHAHGGVAANGTDITLWDSNTHGHQSNLQWVITDAGNGQYFIESVIDRNFVLHQHGGVNDNGAKCTLWDKRTHGQQGNMRVTFQHIGNDLWVIKYVHSGKCVHVHGGKTDNGTPITQWEYVNQANLHWRIVPVHSTPQYFAQSGRKFFLQSQLGHVAHVHGGVAANGTDITLWDQHTHGHQSNLQWHLSDLGNGQFFIESAIDRNFVLHQHGGVNDNGAKCTTWDKRTHGQQGNMRVTFRNISGDLYAIHYVHSNKCIHVHGGKNDNGTPITQWEYVNQPNLHWRLVDF